MGFTLPAASSHPYNDDFIVVGLYFASFHGGVHGNVSGCCPSFHYSVLRTIYGSSH